jgi:hypothetical protein
MLRKRFALMAAVGLALAAALSVGLAAGSPADADTHAASHLARGLDSSVDGNCNVWTDGTTFGVGCTGLPGWYYNAEAECENGDLAIGPTEYGTSGTKSYAYCSTYNSTIDWFFPTFVGPNCAGCAHSKKGYRIFIDSPLHENHHRYSAGLSRAAGRAMTSRPDSSVNGSCNVWTDDITWGIGCKGLPGWYYDSNASCVNGDIAYGPTEYGTSGTKTYAYCSTYDSEVLSAWSNFER